MEGDEHSPERWASARPFFSSPESRVQSQKEVFGLFRLLAFASPLSTFSKPAG
jgi:hypothetical protein